MYQIVISISKQLLYLYKKTTRVKTYPISTSRFGIGNKEGSNKTPLGLHRVISKIGRHARNREILKNRRRTGKCVLIRKKVSKNLDLITSRILRLQGLEPDINKGKGIDSYKRYIYIHGTPDEYSIGKPASHGCIRMKNKDIIELFSLVKRGTYVEIKK